MIIDEDMKENPKNRIGYLPSRKFLLIDLRTGEHKRTLPLSESESRDARTRRCNSESRKVSGTRFLAQMEHEQGSGPKGPMS